LEAAHCVGASAALVQIGLGVMCKDPHLCACSSFGGCAILLAYLEYFTMWLELQAQLAALPEKFLGLSRVLIVVGLVFVLLERKFPLHPQKVLRKSWLIDIGYFYLGAIVPAFVLICGASSSIHCVAAAFGKLA
jgi:hypothetical protein